MNGHSHYSPGVTTRGVIVHVTGVGSLYLGHAHSG